MRRMAAILTFTLATIAIAACGGGGGTPITVVSGNIAYFFINKPANHDTVTVTPGKPTVLTGVAYDESGDALGLIGDTVWLSRNSAIARVDAHGIVTGVAPGSTWVVGTFQPQNSPNTFSDSVLFAILGET